MLKVGDIVKVKNIEVGTETTIEGSHYTFSEKMKPLISKEGNIDYISQDGSCSVEIDGYYTFVYDPEWLELIGTPEIGLKFDSGKNRLNLVPPVLVTEVGKVMTFGANKYGAHNWKQLENMEDRAQAALLRHIYQYLDGEEIDEESGLPHLAHAACNIGFLLWNRRKG